MFVLKSFADAVRSCLGAIFALCLFIYHQPSFGQIACQSVFNSEHSFWGYTKGDSEAALELKYADSFTEKRGAFYKIQSHFLDGYVISRFFPFEAPNKEELRSEEHSWIFSKKQYSSSGHSGFNYEKLISENIDFVLKQYEKRRSWSDDFRDHLHSDAIKYASQSEYFIVRGYPRIKGTLKLVYVDSRTLVDKLPMEEYLGLSLPRNNDLKIEPSNFAILKDYNKIVFPELLLRFVNQAQKLAKTGQYDLDKPIFYTYGDALSVRLYEGMGFHFLSSKKDNMGVEWNILQASLRDIIELPQRIKMNLHPATSDEKELFQNFVSLYGYYQERSAQNVWTHLAKCSTDVDYKPELSISISEEHFYNGNRVKLVQFYTRGDEDGDAVRILIPSSGNKIVSDYNDSQDQQIITIKNHVVEYQKDYSLFKVFLKIIMDDKQDQPLKFVYEKQIAPEAQNYFMRQGFNGDGKIHLEIDVQ